MIAARVVLPAITLLVGSCAARCEGPIPFKPPDCPFTLPIPADMELDPKTVDNVAYGDGTRAVFGTWRRGEIDLEMVCYSTPRYAIPEAFLPAICNKDNPNLVAESLCGPSPHFDGVEVTWPEQRPDDKIKSLWYYVAHKRNAGRLVIHLIDRSASALQPESRRRLADRMKAFAAAMR